MIGFPCHQFADRPFQSAYALATGDLVAAWPCWFAPVTLPHLRAPARFTSASLFIDSASTAWGYLRGPTLQEAQTMTHVGWGWIIDGCSMVDVVHCHEAFLSGLNR